MTYSDAERWYRVIKASSLEILRKEFFKYCAEYAQVRTQWSFLTKEERLERNQSRTLKHNALISSANALSRNMVQNEEDASWRAELGTDRRRIGDFACYVACFIGLENS